MELTVYVEYILIILKMLIHLHLDHPNCEMTMFFILKGRIISHLISEVVLCTLQTIAAAFRPQKMADA
jgi:hypothetical protein